MTTREIDLIERLTNVVEKQQKQIERLIEAVNKLVQLHEKEL